MNILVIGQAGKRDQNMMHFVLKGQVGVGFLHMEATKFYSPYEREIVLNVQNSTPIARLYVKAILGIQMQFKNRFFFMCLK